MAEESAYCANCGKPRSVDLFGCVKCGKILPSAASYCAFCGSAEVGRLNTAAQESVIGDDLESSKALAIKTSDPVGTTIYPTVSEFPILGEPQLSRSGFGGRQISRTNCPACGASDIARTEMVYLQGTSQVVGTTVGLDARGNTGVFATQGIQQSALSSAIGPPPKRTLWWGPIAWLATTMIFGGLAGNSAGSTAVAVIANVVGIFAWVLVWFFVIKYNLKTWPRLYSDWQRMAICMRCGYQFPAFL